MPILLVFLLVAACAPVEWPAPPFERTARTGAAFAGAAVAVLLAAAFVLRTWVVRTLRRRPERRHEVTNVYLRVRRVLFFVNLGAIAAVVAGLGWGWAVQTTLVLDRPFVPRPERLTPFAELLVPLPYFLVLAGCWLIYFDAERALHRAQPSDTGKFWSRLGYFFHNARQFAVLVMLPVVLFVCQQSLGRLWPGAAQSDWLRLAGLAVVPLLLLTMPLVIKPMLGLKTLPAGPARDRIEALARRLRFHYTDLLLWPTRGATMNAMIVGLLPRVRYVIFTDRILDELPPDELDAVFGHEVGHARHGHIWYYALFLALSMAVIAAVLMLLEQTLRRTVTAEEIDRYEDYFWCLSLVPVLAAAGYIFVAFGFLSRRCERQADVFGCRAVSCADPNCAGHTEETVYPVGGAALCPAGIRTFSRALERVDLLNGSGGPDWARPRRTVGGMVREVLGLLRAWQHSTMPRRVGFLLSLIDDPPRERRFQRRLKLLRWGLVIGLAAAFVALGEAIGWRDLLRAM